MPSSAISAPVRLPGCVEARDAMNISRMTMTTTLLTTGVHIGAAKLPRALRIAPASELTP